ncbi:hypothetical protein Ancab_023043 [Ancistrocladus abbreviatus]
MVAYNDIIPKFAEGPSRRGGGHPGTGRNRKSAGQVCSKGQGRSSSLEWCKAQP